MRKFRLSNKIFRKSILSAFLPLCLVFSSISAQDEEGIAAIVFLDSFVVTAQKSGFDVDDFITLVQEDQSFYQAFRNLRFVSYQADNNLRFFTSESVMQAFYQSKTMQHSDGKCRSMKTLSEFVGGNYYEEGPSHRYYTARLFEKVFFTKGKVCDNPADTTIQTDNDLKGIDKHYQSLKRLIFQPGEKVDVPFIGKKMAVFSADRMQYYDYAIRSEKYKERIDCYVFSLDVKPEFKERKEKKTVIKQMRTYFEKSNFQVIARVYQLAYDGLFFSFDVNMEIDLDFVEGKYLPLRINYDGWWNVPFKKKEIGRFEVIFSDYQIP